MADKPQPMTDEDLASLLKRERRSARDFVMGEIGRERRVAYEYYYGKPFGNEEDGRSQVISQVVAEVIDAALPDIIKIFASSDQAVQCTPRNAEDVDAAEQATDLCNYVFWVQNNGFLLLYEGIKDALLQKTGVWQYYWDEEEKVAEEIYLSQTLDQLTMMGQDPAIEIVQASPSQMQMPQLMPAQAMGQAPMPQLYDVRVRITKKAGHVCIESVPPEEVLVSSRARTVDPQKIPYIGTRRRKTLSDLVEMGYDLRTVVDLKSDSDGDDLQEVRAARVQRNGSVEYISEDNEDFANPMLREVWYCEEYPLVDYDGDGIAERRVVCSVGDTILHNETIERVPMAVITPKIMPHEFFGVSLADDTADLQLLKSTLWRQMLDNVYLTNNPLQFVTGKVDLDALLAPIPGGVVRGDPGSAVTPLTVPFTAANTLQMVEFLEQEVSARSGIDRQGFSPSINPDVIQKTLGGANIALNKSQARIELMARTFAETGIVDLFKGILWLLSKYQDTALTLRIRNKFVTIDPRAWSTQYDFTINVGLGTGSKDQQMQHMTMLLGALKEFGGAGIVTPKNLYNAAKEFTNLLGFKDTDRFVTDPMAPPDPNNPKPTPQPPPEVQKAQIQGQVQQQVAQQKMQSQIAIEQAQMQADQQVEMARAQADMMIARHQAQMDAQLDLAKTKMQLELEAAKNSMAQETAILIAKIKASAQVEAADIAATKRADDSMYQQEMRQST